MSNMGNLKPCSGSLRKQIKPQIGNWTWVDTDKNKDTGIAKSEARAEFSVEEHCQSSEWWVQMIMWQDLKIPYI